MADAIEKWEDEVLRGEVEKGDQRSSRAPEGREGSLTVGRLFLLHSMDI